MMKHIAVLFAAFAVAAFIGCEQKPEHKGFPKDDGKSSVTKEPANHAGHDHADHDHTGHSHAQPVDKTDEPKVENRKEEVKEEPKAPVEEEPKEEVKEEPKAPVEEEPKEEVKEEPKAPVEEEPKEEVKEEPKAPVEEEPKEEVKEEPKTPVTKDSSGSLQLEPVVVKTYKETCIDIVNAYKAKRTFDTKYKPAQPIVLPKEFITPDGLAVNPKTGTLFMSVPNFARRPNNDGQKIFPAVLAKVDVKAGKAETVLELEKIKEIEIPDAGIKQIGPMGLTFGPDGHLYVADNQYFFNVKDGKRTVKSRILRVLFDSAEPDKPTGKVEVAVVGTNLSNAIYWGHSADGKVFSDFVYLTDTFFDQSKEVLGDAVGSGGVWQFTKDELLKAGTEASPPILVNTPEDAKPYDRHLIAYHQIKGAAGCGNGGPDGLTADKDGVLYYGFFGNGEMHRLIVGADGKVVSTDEIHPAGKYFHCCDGVYYDAGTNRVYINDSAANAIHYFDVPADTKAPVELKTLWENGDTDGADGSLDQPCECIVVDGKMIIVNFDWDFPELLNTKSDDPSTLSVIELK